MMPPTPNVLLDMRSDIGQIAARFDFELLTENLEGIGFIDAQAGSISNDSTATIKRSLRGFRLKADDARHVNPYTDKVRPRMVLEDGTAWPLGVFQFTDDTIEEGSLHNFYDATLVDQGLRLEAKIRYPFGVPQNGDVVRALVRLYEEAGIFNLDIRLPPARAGAPIAWPSGTKRSVISDQLAQLAGGHRPFFANRGLLTAAVALPFEEGLAHVYQPGKHSRIVVDTRRTRHNLLTAPNVYQVESNALSKAPIVATAFVDPRLPHSVENIGYERPEVIKLQGITDTDHARRVAVAYAETDPLQLEQSSFAGPLDPRHDTFELAAVDGNVYREVSWDLPMSIGADMAHVVTKQIDPNHTVLS